MGLTLADHLTERAGYWHFQRRVPKEYAVLDPSGVIRHSTKVSVKKDPRGIKAGKIADAMNHELEAYWRALDEGKAQEAHDRYNEYRRRARTLGFDYAETHELTKAISVELGAQQASLQRHLESGYYGDASEVIRDALRALDQRDAVFDEVLRSQVLASMANKRPRVPAADVFKRLDAHHVRRTKAAKRGA